jgi:hypothetical protein
MSVDFIVTILDMVLFQVVSFCSGAKNLRSGDHVILASEVRPFVLCKKELTFSVHKPLTVFICYINFNISAIHSQF